MRLFEFLVDGPAFYQAEGVPDFVVEVAALFAQRIVIENVVACGGGQHEAHAHAVGAIGLDEFEGIGRVAERFRHLPSDFVAHDTGKVDILEGFLAGVFIPGHDHAGYPEEDDVGPRYEVARGVVVFHLFVAGVVDAVEERDGPQPRREPGVETIFVLTEIAHLQRVVAALFAGQRESLFGRLGYHESALRQVVGRYAVSPPQLTRDAPVLDVLHPVAVGVLELVGVELDVVIHDGFEGRFGQFTHLDKPLHREFGLDYHVGTLRVAHFVVIILHLFEQVGGLQVFGNLLAHVETVHADIEAAGLADGSVVVEDVDGGQVVFLAQHVVVYVVGRGYFQTAGTELDVDVVVHDDGYDAVDQRHDYLLPFEEGVAGIVGVDAHGRIAQDGFGTGRGHDDVFVLPFDVVAQVVELAVLLLVDYLFVREGGERLGVPVDHAHAAVDETFVVEVDKHFQHTLGAHLVHGEGGAVPVARGTQLLQLFQDDTTMLFFPLPGIFEELLAGEVALLDALGSQFVHHLGLGSNRGVVGSGYPAGVFALHAGAADENVLYRVVEHVPHVQNTGDVGGRNDYGVGFTTVGL